MKEVSCKAIDPFMRAADRCGIPRVALAADTGYTLVQLERKDERIEWQAFRRFMANVSRHFTDDQIIEIGAEGLRSPTVRSIMIVGRVLLSAPGFYRWVVSAGGAGNLLFTCIVPSYREVGPEEVIVELRVAPGYQPCREFFLYAQGGFEAMPKALGLSSARIQAEDIPDGRRFRIHIPREQRWRAGIRKLVSRRLDAQAAATELDGAMRTLEQRYAELDATRAAVEQQKALLDTAYRVGHALWGKRELSAIGEAVTRSLVEIAGYAGAHVVASDPQGQVADARFGACDGGRELEVELIGRRVDGVLTVWLRPDADREAASTLLHLLVPTAALAIDNAFAYQELALYQQDLERRVQERTAELRLARDDLAETVGQLREAIAARERIFANISHEIRTPLSLILLAVADVETRAAAHLDDEAHASLGGVVASARKLLRLVDELLLLAAGQESELRLSPEPTDLARLVTQVAGTWRPAAEAAGITLRCDVPASLPAHVDPVALERVITNLLSNAVKFTPKGGRVAITLVHRSPELRLSVRDTGTGIDDELLPRLFGRFERAKGTRKGGSGIGLSLVKEIAVAHGGRVGVERVPTGGTEIWVALPEVAGDLVVPDHAAAPRLRPEDYGVVDAPVRSGDVLPARKRSSATVLVAEDDPRLAAMIARLLSEDYTVIVALDGAAALELARKHEPHLLVTDIEMPHIDGIELTKRFREAIDNKLAPVVILSAMADLGDRLAGFEAGAIDYVVKPFDPGELTARVRAQLGHRELALRLHRAEQLSALGTLSAGLAHELRNPANAIVNAVGPLKKLLPAELMAKSNPIGQLVDVLGGCAEQIGMLSRQLLSFRRGGDLELKAIPLGDVVQRAITLAQGGLRGVTMRSKVEVADLVKCAPPLIVQVLTNLLENAGQAAGAGGWVDLTASASPGRVEIEIADSGPGVPRDLRERVFEPFFTTKPPGAGTGLGLPLAREIVHRHGGTLDIRERAHGAVFVVELPQESPR